MSVKVKGSSATTYSDLSDYLDALSSVSDENDVTVEFSYNIEDIVALANRETAFRGRAEEMRQEGEHLDNFRLTDNEGYYLDRLERGATEVFKKLFAWAKGLYEAFQFNVLYGGATITYQSAPYTSYPAYTAANALIKGTPVVACSATGITSITLSTPVKGTITENELVGKTIYLYEDSTGVPILVGLTITANTDTIIYVDDSGFDWSSVDPLTPTQYFAQFSVGCLIPDLGDESVVYYVEINEDSRYDKLLNVDHAIEQALAWSLIKEWYRTNRMMDDYAIEEQRYKEYLWEVRSNMMDIKDVSKRKGFFDHDEETVISTE